MSRHYSTIIWVIIFGIAMAYIESAVVVYLRAIFHPDGSLFPLKNFSQDPIIIVEIYREVATIVMLITVSAIAGRKFWERFGYFIAAFGIWDIFYYVWLKVILDWPATLFDWDVLFLIPKTWIGPVIAPVSVALIMVIAGMLLVNAYQKGLRFRPSYISIALTLAGTAVILYSFMYDTGAIMDLNMPKPYPYSLLIIGDIMFIAAFTIPYLKMQWEG